MTLYDYVAYGNPKGASDVVRYHGLRPTGDPKITAKQLAVCVAGRGQEALEKVMENHPDVGYFSEKIKPVEVSHSSACGCNSENGFSNANGQDMKSDVKSRLTDKSELLITGGIILIGLAMVLKLMK